METKKVREIKVFLASSKETFDERVLFGDFVSGLNNMFSSVNIQFLLHKWEYFSSDIAPKDKQEEYNDTVRESEISIVLFWRRIGWFTQRELNAALEAQKANPKTKRVFVYLKAIDEQTEISPEDLRKLNDFKDHFYDRCQNWPTVIHNNDEFKLSVLQNLIIYLNEGGAGISPFSATEGIIDIGGKTSIDLKNVPFIGDNEEYKLLCETIDLYERTLKTLKPEDLEYSKCAAQLIERKDRRDAMENGLLETALTVSKLKTTRCSERLKQAIALFEKGDSRGAQAILDTEAITKDVQANKDLIEAGNELVDKGREGLKTNLDEYLLRIDLLTDEMKEGWKEEVELLFEKCFEIGEDNLEKKRYADLLSQYSLYLDTIAEYEKALENATKALDIRRSLFDENHADVATSYNNVGVTYKYLGRDEKALENLMKALDIMKTIFGDTHTDIATTYNNIGSVYGDMGDHKMALEYKQKALELMRSISGENHPTVATFYNNVGSTLGNMGNYKEALEHQMKAMEILHSLSGENQPYITMTYTNVGINYQHLGKHKEALEYYLKALNKRRSIFGENHPLVAASYNNVGTAYRSLNRPDTALVYLLKALEISRSLFGENNSTVAVSYDNSGSAYMDLGNREKALEFQQKALDIRRSLFGEKHLNVALSYNSLGVTYNRIGDHDKALEFHQKALDIRLSLLDEKHPDIGTSYNNMGVTYQQLGNHQNAAEYLQKALDIQRSTLGENHPDVAATYHNLGLSYHELGIDALASQCFFKATAIEKALKKRDEENSHS